MAEISFVASQTSPVGGDMCCLDLAALIGTMPVSFVLANDIAWRAGDFSTILDIGGSGLVAQITNGSLTNVSAGTVSGIAFQGPGYSLTYRNTPAMSAEQFMTFFTAADWTGLARYLTAGNDTISGSLHRDILLGGAGNDFLTSGKLGNDVMNGGAGNDTVIASDGHDRLTGGTGADQFLYQSAPFTRREFDQISDFAHGEDQIALQTDGIGELGAAGRLRATQFAQASHATTADQHLVYDRAAGRLYFDFDGSGSGHKVLMIEFAPGTQLAAQDFWLV